MKVIGARTYQIAGLYFGTVLLLGIAGLVIGIPAGIWAGMDLQHYCKSPEFQHHQQLHPALGLRSSNFSWGCPVPLLAAAFPVTGAAG